LTLIGIIDISHIDKEVLELLGFYNYKDLNDKTVKKF